ncbi:MAG: EAL domain-containing protein [Actinomycetota bacterium]|nr:EAL domain-containing protein [Actinomycetota bacterium]
MPEQPMSADPVTIAAAGGVWAGDIETLLGLVCRELEMETGFIGRVAEGQRAICYVSGSGLNTGDSDPYDETYCQLIAEGTIGPAVADTSVVPVLRDMPITHRLGIASYLGLPLRLADGSLYGTLCAYSREVKPHLVDADVRLLRLVGALVASRLEHDVQAERRSAQRRAVIETVLAAGQPDVVFQPIVDLASGDPLGYEALARFAVDPYRPPNVWMTEAAAVELGVELELQAIANALAVADGLPADRYLSLNASPSVVVTGRLVGVLVRCERPIIVEVTEHEEARGVDLSPALGELRATGHRIALDDAGAGYAGLTRLLELRPDVVKLDRAIIAGIDTDPVRQAMVTAGVAFVAGVGSSLVAEGVETACEAATLRALGVRVAQGYLFGRPAPVAHFRSPGAPPLGGATPLHFRT